MAAAAAVADAAAVAAAAGLVLDLNKTAAAVEDAAVSAIPL